MRITEAFNDPDWGRKIIQYVDACISNQRAGIEHDKKNDIKSLVLLRLLDVNPTVREKGWKKYLSEVVHTVLADDFRRQSPEVNESALERTGDEDGSTKSIYDRECDSLSLRVHEMAMTETDDNKPPDDAPLSDWLDWLFRQLCQNFRALNEFPAHLFEGDPETVLPILDAAATAHLSKQEWVDKWFAIWRDIRTHNEDLNLTQIANRVGCDKNTVKKAVERWVLVSGTFQTDVVTTWESLDDGEKAEWLSETMSAIRQGILSDIVKLQRNLDLIKWQRLNKLS